MIYFRADANENIGLGHVMRCLALADGFRALGKECLFILASDTKNDAIITQRGYSFVRLTNGYLEMAKEAEELQKILSDPEAIFIVDSYFVPDGYEECVKRIIAGRGRYICFDGPYAYVTSYAGPVSVDASHAQIGYVARIDTATLEVMDQCLVGYQPDELAVVGNKLYVANSGGYMVPNYDTTVSVIDLTTFKETRRITVAKNLWLVRPDAYGYLWVSSRGDYYDTRAKLYCIDSSTDQVVDSLDVSVSSMDIVGDSLYACATDWNYETYDNEITYTIVNVRTRQVVTRRFITDGTDAQIDKPYCVRFHPITRDIYITDAKNYVTPGNLHCYSPEGVLRWSTRTGDIPAKIAFLYE